MSQPSCSDCTSKFSCLDTVEVNDMPAYRNCMCNDTETIALSNKCADTGHWVEGKCKDHHIPSVLYKIKDSSTNTPLELLCKVQSLPFSVKVNMPLYNLKLDSKLKAGDTPKASDNPKVSDFMNPADMPKVSDILTGKPAAVAQSANDTECADCSTKFQCVNDLSGKDMNKYKACLCSDEETISMSKKCGDLGKDKCRQDQIPKTLYSVKRFADPTPMELLCKADSLPYAVQSSLPLHGLDIKENQLAPSTVNIIVGVVVSVALLIAVAIAFVCCRRSRRKRRERFAANTGMVFTHPPAVYAEPYIPPVSQESQVVAPLGPDNAYALLDEGVPHNVANPEIPYN